MGFFDRFKGEPAASKPQRSGVRPAPASVLHDIIKAYGLKEKEPYEPSIGGAWWEGEAGATRFAVQEHSGKVFVHIGRIDEITDIYLSRVMDKRPLPPEHSPSRLDRIVQGHPISRQFFLLAHPSGTFDHPRLRQGGVADGLACLSDRVAEVMLYEQYQGVTLVIEGSFTQADFDRDLEAGVKLLQAVENR